MATFEGRAWAAGGEASRWQMLRFARRVVGLRRGFGWLGAGECASRRLRRRMRHGLRLVGRWYGEARGGKARGLWRDVQMSSAGRQRSTGRWHDESMLRCGVALSALEKTVSDGRAFDNRDVGWTESPCLRLCFQYIL